MVKFALNGGSIPKVSPRDEFFLFCAPASGKQLLSPRSGALENVRPLNRVFTPHCISEIPSVRVVYGVNRNLLIEICPKPPLPQRAPVTTQIPQKTYLKS